MFNKFIAVIYLVLFCALFIIAKPIECFVKAAVDSGLVNMGWFVEVFLKEWNSENQISFTEAKEIFLTYWNGDV